MAEAVGEPPRRWIDLGSGGGVPALVLLELWPSAEAVLVEAARRRSAFLSGALAQLGWEGRARVVEARAEEVGRDPEYRGAVGLVTARSFAAPGVTAECAAPLLRPGGRLVVSEPPAAVDRWPAAGLQALGMEAEAELEVAGFHFRLLRQAAVCPDRYPRRTGVPGRRPLF